MEKHCERQHGLTPPGGRGNYIGSTESHTTEREQIASPFQQVRTYPTHQGRKVTSATEPPYQVLTSAQHQEQPHLVHPATRY